MKKMIILCCGMIVVMAYAHAQGDSVSTDTLGAGTAVQVHEKIEAAVPLAKVEADSAYLRGDYMSAIAIYEAILAEKGESAEIYYNLGNSYYKNNNIAKSILNLERALLLEPGDGDIRFNLELAKSKAVDKVVPVSEVFFVTWFRSAKNCLGADGWAKVAIAFFLVLLLSLAMYVFGKRLAWKKIGFVVAAVALVVAVMANVFAYSQKKLLTDRKEAIIMVPSVTVKSTPNEGGTDLFILHEGHKVHIRDSSMKEWAEIGLEDGNVGWIPVSVMEII